MKQFRPFTFIGNEIEQVRELEYQPDMTIGQAIGLVAAEAIAEMRGAKYLQGGQFIMDTSQRLSFDNGPIEILAAEQQFEMESVGGMTLRVLAATDIRCCEMWKKISGSPIWSHAKNAEWFSPDDLSVAIDPEAHLWPTRKNRSQRWLVVAHRCYEFHIYGSGCRSIKVTHKFSDRTTIGECKKCLAARPEYKDRHYQLKLSQDGADISDADFLVNTVAKGSINCQLLDPEFTFQLPDGTEEKRRKPISTTIAELARGFRDFKYTFVLNGHKLDRSDRLSLCYETRPLPSPIVLRIRYSFRFSDGESWVQSYPNDTPLSKVLEKKAEISENGAFGTNLQCEHAAVSISRSNNWAILGM
jgi:hypothetical protein